MPSSASWDCRPPDPGRRSGAAAPATSDRPSVIGSLRPAIGPAPCWWVKRSVADLLQLSGCADNQRAAAASLICSCGSTSQNRLIAPAAPLRATCWPWPRSAQGLWHLGRAQQALSIPREPAPGGRASHCCGRQSAAPSPRQPLRPERGFPGWKHQGQVPAAAVPTGLPAI